MRLGVIGAGYVGICTGVGFCQLGHEVTLADIDAARIDIINSGKSPIFEAGLDALIASLVGNKKLKATCDIDETVRKNDVIFICVGTPSDNEGRINLDFVKTVSSQIGKALSGHQGYPVIVVKSSVLPGTTESVIIPLLEKSSHLKMGTDFGAAMNPEFLAEGRALHDFLNPDRIVIGTPDEKSHEILSSLYRDFSSPALKVNFRTAEMIKYASNAALAARISFINEIGNICKLLDIDTYQVSRGVGLDPRIGPSFLNAGIGFGGSCLPKDVRALAAQADDLGYEAGLLKSVLKVNQDQPAKFVDFVESKIGSLENRKVAVLGLAFKPGTDDLRDSPALKIVRKLIDRKAIIKAYDPAAEAGAKEILGASIAFADELEQAIAYSDIVLVLTEWENLKNPALYAGKSVFAGRRIFDPEQVTGFYCEGLCW